MLHPKKSELLRYNIIYPAQWLLSRCLSKNDTKTTLQPTKKTSPHTGP